MTNLSDYDDDDDFSMITEAKEETKLTPSDIELHAFHYNLPSPLQTHPEWLQQHSQSLSDELEKLINVDLENLTEPTISKKIGRVSVILSAISELKYPLKDTLRTSILRRALELVSVRDEDITISDDGKTTTYNLSRPIMSQKITSTKPFPRNETTEDLTSLTHKPTKYHLSAPTRDKLLSITTYLLEKKVYWVEGEFIIHWRSLLSLLVSECPYLDEKLINLSPPRSSSQQCHSIQSKLIAMISLSRRFFDNTNDKCSSALVELFPLTGIDTPVSSILSYRDLALFTLFLPTNSSPEFYTRHVSHWLSAWSGVSRNIHWDSCFLTLFCRARKYCFGEALLWHDVRRLILSRIPYHMQLPVGDGGEFSAASVSPSSFTAKLKVLVGGGSRSGSGGSGTFAQTQKMMRQMAKLLIFTYGTSDGCDDDNDGDNEDLLRFFHFVAPFLHPSHVGRWSYSLAGLLYYVSASLAKRVGEEYAKEEGGKEVVGVGVSLDAGKICLLLDAMWPLVFQAVYSKISQVEWFGTEAYTNLVSIAPLSILPYSLHFSLNALSPSSVNTTHQAPSALSLLHRSLRVGLRHAPNLLCENLDQIVSLSLPGLDGNDKKKTSRTLGLLCHLGTYYDGVSGVEDTKSESLSVSVPGTTKVFDYTAKDLSTSPAFSRVCGRLPPTTPLSQAPLPVSFLGPESFPEYIPSLSTPSYNLMDRLYTLLTTLDFPNEKKTRDGVASFLSRLDEDTTRAFSDALAMAFLTLASSYGTAALRDTFAGFLARDGRLLPHAAKDVGGLARAAVAVGGLDGVVRAMIRSVNGGGSAAALRYETRVLAGGVRYAGKSLLSHKAEIMQVLDVTLHHANKAVRKSGCKLLRHVLACLVECYPTDWRVNQKNNGVLGGSAEIGFGQGGWHNPTGEEIDWAVHLLATIPLTLFNQWESQVLANNENQSPISQTLIEQGRRAVKILHYSLRGAIRLLVDDTKKNPHPCQKATLNTISLASISSQTTLKNLRASLTLRITNLLSTLTVDPSIPTDIKITKDLLQSLEILLIQRSASSQLHSMKRYHATDKFISRDVVLKARTKSIIQNRKHLNTWDNQNNYLYKNGQNGGKTQSHNLLVIKMWLHYQHLEYHMRFAIPRQLRFEDHETYKTAVKVVLALCCHESINVRTMGLLTFEMVARYWGYILRELGIVGHLLSALELSDDNTENNVIPSCAKLANTGEGKRLAQVLRGVCNVLQLKPCLKEMINRAPLRARFMKAVCGVENLIKAVPVDEAPAVVGVTNALFLQFRARWYDCVPSCEEEKAVLVESIDFLLYQLEATEDNGINPATTTTASHWKYKMMAGWFLLISVSKSTPQSLVTRGVHLAAKLIKSERGQPIQRLALGLLGLITSYHPSIPINIDFASLTHALMVNHKGNVSHDGLKAQWSHGIEEILRDASKNIAIRGLYPLSCVNTKGIIRISHMSFLENILINYHDSDSDNDANVKQLLDIAKQMAFAGPSEDQQNEHCTAAEIAGAVGHFLLHHSPNKISVQNSDSVNLLLSFLESVLMQIPPDAVTYWGESLRYMLNDYSRDEVLSYMVQKVEDTLQVEEEGSGFSSQSKWLTLMSSVLIECNHPIQDSSAIMTRLLRQLLSTLHHPYEACRNGIASCLYRISCINRSSIKEIITAFHEKLDEGGAHHYIRLTLSRLLSYCVHCGDDKFDFTQIVIPLLPLAFKSLNVSNHEGNKGDVATASLDSDVTKSFRTILASISHNSLLTFGDQHEIATVLTALQDASQALTWQVRSIVAHFLRCFHNRHVFLISESNNTTATNIVTALLADERREVSSAAMAALTGILAVTSSQQVHKFVIKTIPIANKYLPKRKSKKTPSALQLQKQQTSVFSLCAAVLSRPYDTPAFVPLALEALSKHSFEKRAPGSVRDVVKKTFADFKKTHVDNWELHKKRFTVEQLEALADVVSTPHYYA